MKMIRSSIVARWVVVAGTAVAAVSLVASVSAMGPNTTAPATSQSTSRAPQAIIDDLRAAHDKLSEALGDPSELSEPAKRQEKASKAVPVLKQMLGYFKELVDIEPAAREKVEPAEQQFLTYLSVLGDKDSQDRLQRMADSKDSTESIRGRSGQLMARWITAGKDAANQSKVVDDLESLDKAHPDNASLTLLTATLSLDAATPELATRMENIATQTMNGPIVDQVKTDLATAKAQKAQMDADLAKLRLMENKPLEIKGKTIDGKDFTTADWKGKVVLVDFWATWCGPCRATLPSLKKLYQDNHDKGLEVVGVSNDFDAGELKSFVEKEQLPWPQLFNPTNAANHEWNSITSGFGIEGIPMTFLIDKKGILRTVEAREKMNDMVPKLLAE